MSDLATDDMKVVLLSGGTGGAKLAEGLQQLLGDRLTVIANTADDIEFSGLRVSPDPDLITYWLAGLIDAERGWGIAGDTFAASAQLAALGAPVWFSLGDRDLATCLYRTHFIDEGGTLAGAQQQIARSLGATAQVVPMCEADVRTFVHTPDGARTLQEFLIVDRGEALIEGVEVRGLDNAEAAPEALAALAEADLIVIGPSNPVISIGPILAVPGMRDAIAAAGAPVVAVSPLIEGASVKGPTDEFLAALGRPVSAAGVASLYAGLLDAMVIDPHDPEPPHDIRTLVCNTLMTNAEARLDLARQVTGFGAALAVRGAGLAQ